MKIGLIDPCTLIYTVQTPREHALGGSESAGSFLALEWARLGHEVWYFSRNPESTSVSGVQGRCRDLLSPAWLDEAAFDVLIEMSLPRYLPRLKPLIKQSPPCLLWQHVDASEKRLNQLQHGELAAHYDRVIFVSRHQERGYMLRFQLDPHQTLVIPNGINPVFESLYADRASLAQDKQVRAGEVRLVYASSPHKGMDLLPVVFPAFRRRYPAARLAVYSSSRDLYQSDLSDRAQAQTFSRLTEMEGVMCQGSLPPLTYAPVLQESQILLYPCYAMADTCAIVLLEAMVAGCLVVPTGLGALPETAAVFGFLAHYNQPKELPDALFVQLLRAAQLIQGDPEAYLDHLWAQHRYILSRHTWALAARNWLELFAKLGL